MIAFTSADAQSRFGALVDLVQREPVQLTRCGRTVDYVVSAHDMEAWKKEAAGRADMAAWFSAYSAEVTSEQKNRGNSKSPDRRRSQRVGA